MVSGLAVLAISLWIVIDRDQVLDYIIVIRGIYYYGVRGRGVMGGCLLGKPFFSKQKKMNFEFL